MSVTLHHGDCRVVLDTLPECSVDSVCTDGSAARFFYCPKAEPTDRDDGLQGGNRHPTVKPTALMAWLCKLITPPGGTILDLFVGSGSTGRGAVLGDFNFIGIEREAEYVEIARRRINAISPLFVAA